MCFVIVTNVLPLIHANCASVLTPWSQGAQTPSTVTSTAKLMIGKNTLAVTQAILSAMRKERQREETRITQFRNFCACLSELLYGVAELLEHSLQYNSKGFCR